MMCYKSKEYKYCYGQITNFYNNPTQIVSCDLEGTIDWVTIYRRFLS